jgi:hypothetical protein
VASSARYQLPGLDDAQKAVNAENVAYMDGDDTGAVAGAEAIAMT